jgi:hypothetical protein
MTGAPDDYTRLVLCVRKEDVSRHRGLMVHRAVGDLGWTLSAEIGMRLCSFHRRETAERAMRAVSEVGFNFEKLSPTDLHWALVKWERVPAEQTKAIAAILRRLMNEEDR